MAVRSHSPTPDRLHQGEWHAVYTALAPIRAATMAPPSPAAIAGGLTTCDLRGVGLPEGAWLLATFIATGRRPPPHGPP
jgi:hypothetical protein